MPNRIGNFFNRVTGNQNNQNPQNNRRRGVQPPALNPQQPEIAQGAGRVIQAGANNLQNQHNAQRPNNNEFPFAQLLSPDARQIMAGLSDLDDDAYDQKLDRIMLQMIGQLVLQEGIAPQRNPEPNQQPQQAAAAPRNQEQPQNL